ncbi:hypothetical protein RRG08_003744 [Elysia crispata]|uniref:Uncharacterized protein n=1 Tax=Elysia crispata TaxID=231223 RepID=A0AAE1E555_9GAST|nr:hypothetical protein RRG08_003744 [Elysia crispata]
MSSDERTNKAEASSHLEQRSIASITSSHSNSEKLLPSLLCESNTQIKLQDLHSSNSRYTFAVERDVDLIRVLPAWLQSK